MLRVLAVCLLGALAGCKVNEETRLVAIIGAVLIDGNGGPPITDSVVVVSGSRIRSAGLRANVPIPAAADKINGSGKFLVPGLIDLYCTAECDSGISSGVTTTRQFKTTGPTDLLLLRPGPASDTVLEEARKNNAPVTAVVTTLAQAKQLVNSGVAGFVGMIEDTEDIDQSFLTQLRSLKVVFTPALAAARPEARGIATRNTRRLAAAGVPIGVGSGGAAPETLHEMELLAEAGLSPLEITAAATRTGAMALRKLTEVGTVEAGKRADLLLLTSNPLEDVRNFRKIDQVMRNGEWLLK